MPIKELIDKHAAECYEAQIESIRKDGSTDWFIIIAEHMRNLVCDIEEIASHSRDWNNKARFD